MKINNLELPNLLIEVIDSNLWHEPNDVSSLAELTKFDKPSSLEFYNIEWMKKVTSNLYKIYNSDDRIFYGLASSKISETPILNLELLDIDNCIVLADNNDEDCICLDYRYDKLKPIIVATKYDSVNQKFTYIKIADSFEEFATKIGIYNI